MIIDFMAQLPPFPRDPLDQIAWFNRLKTLLNNMDAAIDNAVVDVVTLEQTTLPSQATWETAYTSQTGKSLPIPPSARLLWWDTTNARFGGVFGTLTNDDTVYARLSLNAPGAVHLMENDIVTGTQSVDYNIGENLAHYPSVTVSPNVAVKFRLALSLSLALSSGSGSWGGDFLINGVKIGGVYYALASNRGILERTTAGQILIKAETPTLEPDTYEIQAIFGRTNATTPTLTAGNRLLLVKGIAQ